MKKKGISYYKKKADGIFSEYIRRSAANFSGYVDCVSCGRTLPWNRGIDAGHFVSRKVLKTRYDERNVHPQCKGCNGFKSGNMINYYQWMESNYSKEVIDELNYYEQHDEKLQVQDYIDIIEKYKNKLKTLK